MRTRQSHKSSVGDSLAKLPKQHLELEEIVAEPIPLIISEKLQTQIYYLCSQIWDVEWSGTLFYETEGEFGDRDFKIYARELFLRDIGTATYTEYEGDQPEFFHFMMANPELLEMKKGHIHSHNSMGVFFSGTDSSELVDNSEFYNYYLSLIVNNRNEMVAKVVFRALCETVSTTKMIFKGNDGKELIQEVVEGNQEERAYGHDCEIQLPNLLPDSFRTRISDIRDAKKRLREEATRAAKESSAARKESSLRDIHSQTDTGGYYLRTEDSYQPD